MTNLRVEIDLDGLPNLLKFGKREKDVAANLSWSFLSDLKQQLKDLKSVAPYKIKVLKDLTSYVEVDIAEDIAPRELKVILFLDFCKWHLNLVHVIEDISQGLSSQLHGLDSNAACEGLELKLLSVLLEQYVQQYPPPHNLCAPSGSFEHDFVEEEKATELKELSAELLAEAPTKSEHGNIVDFDERT
ncbi:hypothetical protein CFP56_034920 [Quercus suber]|uniref:Uncharacterized protein n=1 Tax=Quercus suber TaxID=58331 RepID=A0AAW0JBL2_QUESU